MVKRKDPVIVRLNRIEGQIAGIRKMYEKDPCKCDELIIQIQAVRSALSSTGVEIFSDEAGRCIENGDTKKLKTLVDNTFKIL